MKSQIVISAMKKNIAWNKAARGEPGVLLFSCGWCRGGHCDKVSRDLKEEGEGCAALGEEFSRQTLQGQSL